MKWKECFTAILVVMITCMTTACRLTTNGSESNNQNADEKAQMEKSTIMSSIKEQDVQSLINLLTKQVRESGNIENEVTGFYSSINGTVISYDDTCGNVQSGKIRDGQKTEKIVEGTIRDIKTNESGNYMIVFQSYVHLEGEPESEGIYHISLYDYDEVNQKAGALLSQIGLKNE